MLMRAILAISAAILTHPAQSAGPTLSRIAGEGAERSADGDAILYGLGN
jgi:hypothetical protein